MIIHIFQFRIQSNWLGLKEVSRLSPLYVIPHEGLEKHCIISQLHVLLLQQLGTRRESQDELWHPYVEAQISSFSGIFEILLSGGCSRLYTEVPIILTSLLPAVSSHSF